MTGSITRGWRRFEALVVDDMRFRWALIVINLGGAVYGFSWYFDQLATTDWHYWPVVPDSPLSALSFGIVLLLYTYGKRARGFEAISYMMMIKYGLWAAIVLTGYAVAFHNPTFETTHLAISHTGMALEAYIYLKRYHPGLWAGIVGVIWVVTNDFFDYTYMTHPSLPHPALLPAAKIISYTLTVGVIALYYLMPAARRRQERRSQ